MFKVLLGNVDFIQILWVHLGKFDSFKHCGAILGILIHPDIVGSSR